MVKSFLSQGADSQIPATHLQREVARPDTDYFFCATCTVLYLAFGFDSRLDSSSISVRVKVHNRYHSGEFGLITLEIKKIYIY